jgi:hypothetical protein
MTEKVSRIKIGKLTRTKVVRSSGGMKTQKVVTTTNSKNGNSRLKVVDYSPAKYFGIKGKTKTIYKNGIQTRTSKFF